MHACFSTNKPGHGKSENVAQSQKRSPAQLFVNKYKSCRHRKHNMELGPFELSKSMPLVLLAAEWLEDRRLKLVVVFKKKDNGYELQSKIRNKPSFTIGESIPVVNYKRRKELQPYIKMIFQAYYQKFKCDATELEMILKPQNYGRLVLTICDLCPELIKRKKMSLRRFHEEVQKGNLPIEKSMTEQAGEKYVGTKNVVIFIRKGEIVGQLKAS